MKFNEIEIVRHGCELKVKPTTIENRVVILSFGTSQFVSFVDSRNRTHDENAAPNGSRKIQQNTKKNIFHRHEKSNREELQWQNTLEKCGKNWKRVQKDPLSWKNCEKHAIS